MRIGIRQKIYFVLYQMISWALIALVALMIHSFSLQDEDTSSALSLEVTDVAVRIRQPEGKINRNTDAYRRMHALVRKGAHALEYTLLALAVMMVLAPFDMRLWKKVLLALILCAAFAGYDEWSQASSLGRMPSKGDVAIDAAGALLGCVLALAARQTVLLAQGAREVLTSLRRR